MIEYLLFRPIVLLRFIMCGGAAQRGRTTRGRAGSCDAMTAKGFASTEDTGEKKASFGLIDSGLYRYLAEGDPNADMVVGGVMVINVQARPALAVEMIVRVAKVTDKAIKFVLLTHYQAVRALGAALTAPKMAAEGIALTSDFIATLYRSVSESVGKGRPRKDVFDFARFGMDRKFKTLAFCEHWLPFNVVRAYNKARSIEWPVIWAAWRDREMWAALQN
jgi:hypothetical protein